MMGDKLQLYLITFNCALVQHDVAALSSHLLSGLEPPSSSSLPSPSTPPREPDLIVLSLQEIAPLAVAFLGGPNLAGYFEPFSTAIRTSTRKLFGQDYALVARSNVGMTGIMVFARNPAQVSSIAYAGVGAGLWEMGNKGGVGVKLHYKSVEMNFLAAHLAPGEKDARLRNDNWGAIVRGTVFDPPATPLADDVRPVGLYSPTAHLFVLGDLNYRTSDQRPGSLEFLVFPQPADHQSSNKHFMNLLEYDQLAAHREAGRTLHGLEEAPIGFPPTYKYIVNASSKGPDGGWNWMPLRWPSWTDRILYLPTPSARDITVHRYTSIPEIQSSDHRPVVAHISVPATPLHAAVGLRASPPFRPDPQWREKRDAARKREIAVGVAAYLVATWSGRAMLVAVFAGALAGWWVLKGLVTMGM